MKNRWISMIIAATMSLSLLAACGPNLEAPKGDAPQQKEEEGQEAETLEDGGQDSVIVAMGPTLSLIHI